MTERSPFEAFADRVLTDGSLQRELKVFRDQDPFVSRVVELGRTSGFDFSEEAVRDAIQRNRRAWIERWMQT